MHSLQSMDNLEYNLRDALGHLYDLTYHPPRDIWALLGVPPAEGWEALRESLIGAIEDLKPDDSTPEDAPAKRIYDLLILRYVQGLTQEAAAEQLALTPRYLRKQQTKAIQTLVTLLLERQRLISGGPLPSSGGEPIQSHDWDTQVEAELASLGRSAPTKTADVMATIQGAVALAASLVREHGVSLKVVPNGPDQTAAMHPSALRQILLTAISKLAEGMDRGEIVIRGSSLEDHASITLTGNPGPSEEQLDVTFIQKVLAAHHGELTVQRKPDGLTLSLQIPLGGSVPRVNVLVIEDNEDLAAFYRAYTEGTRYHIIHETDPRQALDTVGRMKPDVVVLDVMLPDPDLDGWELLAQIHQHPDTCAIPVIICSVVREEQLSLSLGASLHLSKPVWRHQFIEALDKVLSQAPTAAPESAGYNAGSGQRKPHCPPSL